MANHYKNRKRIQVYKKPGVSLTEQHHAKACDINAIMAKYLKTGVLDHVKENEALFGDISQLDFKGSMDTIKAVETQFYDLPAYARKHYQGDPQKYLAAISTEEGIRELRNLKPPGMQYDRDGNRETPPAAAETAPAAPEGDSETVT